MNSTLVRPSEPHDRRRLLRPGRPLRLKPGPVRLLFVLSCLLPGPQFIAYIVLWIVMPDGRRHDVLTARSDAPPTDRWEGRRDLRGQRVAVPST